MLWKAACVRELRVAAADHLVDCERNGCRVYDNRTGNIGSCRSDRERRLLTGTLGQTGNRSRTTAECIKQKKAERENRPDRNSPQGPALRREG